MNNELIRLNVIRFRKEKGFTIVEVASQLGIQERSYRRLESGERSFMLDHLLKLKVLFDCSLDDFMNAENQIGTIDREQLLSVYDLKQMGLNSRLSHALVKTVWDESSVEFRSEIKNQGKVKYVLKKEVSDYLNEILVKL